MDNFNEIAGANRWFAVLTVQHICDLTADYNRKLEKPVKARRGLTELELVADQAHGLAADRGPQNFFVITSFSPWMSSA